MDFKAFFIVKVFLCFGLRSSWSAPVTYSTYSCPKNINSVDTHLVFEKTCYEFVTSRKDYWTGARHDCNNRGGDLAIVTNGNIQYFLQTTLQKLNVGNHGVWIGLHDRDHEGHFTWVDGTPIFYSHWAVHEGYGPLHLTQDCVQIDMGDHGLWHDRECHLWPNKFSYICQFPVLETVHTVQPQITTTASKPTTSTTSSSKTEPTTSVVVTTTASTTRPSTTMQSTTTIGTTETPSTTMPNREYPQTTTLAPDREYPSSTTKLTTTEQPNREFPPTTLIPDREFPQTTFAPDREYPSSTTKLQTTEQPNREFSPTTLVPDREYPITSKATLSTTEAPNREYPQTTLLPNKEFPSSTVEEGHFLTPAPESDGCNADFQCSLDCTAKGYLLGADDCPVCQCNA